MNQTSGIKNATVIHETYHQQHVQTNTHELHERQNSYLYQWIHWNYFTAIPSRGALCNSTQTSMGKNAILLHRLFAFNDIFARVFRPWSPE